MDKYYSNNTKYKYDKYFIITSVLAILIMTFVTFATFKLWS